MVLKFDEYTKINEGTLYEPNMEMGEMHKLSELSYEMITGILGKKKFCMPVDNTDALREVSNEYAFNNAQKKLMDNYGDVDIFICTDPDVIWSKEVSVQDEKWKNDRDEYSNRKAAWCSKYGSN